MMKFLKNLFKRKPNELEEPSAQMTIVLSKLRAPEPVSFNPVLSEWGNVVDKGETICCKNGHVVCHAQRDLKYGDMQWGDTFGEWEQPEPEIGNTVGPCIHCGAPWLDSSYGIYVKSYNHDCVVYRGIK